MKGKCKVCDKKFKAKCREDVECDQSQCPVKYDVDYQELNFGNFNPDLPKVEIIEDIKSECQRQSYSSVASRVINMTDDEWAVFQETGALPDSGEVCPF